MRAALALIATFVLATACGGSSKQQPVTNTTEKPAEKKPPITTCEELIARSRKALDEAITKGAGRPPTESEVKMIIEACNAPDAQADRDKLFACVGAAADDAAVKECWFPKQTADGGGGDGKHRASEAAIYLNKLGKNAKVEWMTSAEFPKGKAGPLPAAPCPCPKKCPVTDAWSKDPVWTALEFVVDEETFYTFTYESDGKTFRATASADLDCDGNRSEFVLTGVGTPDGAEIVLTPPPKGVY